MYRQRTIFASIISLFFFLLFAQNTVTSQENEGLQIGESPVDVLLETSQPNRILILGDSIKGTQSLDNMGWAYLMVQNFPEYDITIAGKGGYTIKSILSELRKLDLPTYNHVILEIGINDSRYRPSLGGNEIGLEEFKAGLHEFVRRFDGMEGQLYFVGITRVDESRTLPIVPDKYFENAYIELYDQIIQDVAVELAITYIRPADFENNPTLLEDGLHPNKQGHDLMYRTIVAQLPFLNINMRHTRPAISGLRKRTLD